MTSIVQNNRPKWVKLAELLLWLCLTVLIVKAVILFISPNSYSKLVDEDMMAPMVQGEEMGAANNQSEVRPQTESTTGTLALNFDPFYRDQQTTQINLGQSAPETSLQLRLYGRRTGGKGSAIIETPDGQQNSYVIKDEILPNVFLQAVHKDYVVISRRGTLERLTFDDTNATGLLKPASTETQTPEGAPKNVTQQQNVQKQMQKLLPRNGTKSQAAILGNFKLEPVLKNNTHMGFAVYPRNANVNLSQYGIQAGDVITDIDGVKLVQDPDAIRDIVHAIQGKQQIEIKLKRQGKAITRVIRVQE